MTKISMGTSAAHAFLFMLAISTGLVHAATVSDDDIRTQYDADTIVRSKLKEYRVSQIVVKDRDLAYSLAARLANGESFAALARDNSIDLASRKKGGDLGWAMPADYYPEVAKALLAMSVGDTSKTPISTKLGWHIFHLDAIRPGQAYSLEERKEQIREELQKKFDRIDVIEQEWRSKKQASELSAQQPHKLYLASLILTKFEEDAQKGMNRVLEGETFENVARDISISKDTASKGGDLGWRDAISFSGEIVAAMDKLYNGDMSKPIFQSDGWWVVMLRDSRLAPVSHEVVSPMSLLLPSSRKDLNDMAFSWPSGPGVLKRLLNAGADPNGVLDGETILGRNCSGGLITNVKLLLAAGASPNPVQGAKLSPIDSCITGIDSMSGLSLLIAAGANVNARDGFGIYPISAAAGRDNVDAIQLLVRRGASVNQHNDDNSTPLVYATWIDASESVASLLQLGANPLEVVSTNRSGNKDSIVTALSSASQYAKTKPSKVLPLLRAATTNAALQRSKRALSAVIVQDGHRYPMDGKPVTLRRGPFELEVNLTSGIDFMVHASNTEESVASIRQHPNETDFGNATHSIQENDAYRKTLVISDASNLRYQHWQLIGAPAGKDGSYHGRLSVANLRYENQRPSNADTSLAATTVGIEQISHPIYLAIAVGDSIGVPYTSVSRLLTSEIHWRN